MKKIIPWIVVVLVVIGGIYVYLKPNNKISKQNETIKIGASVALSGKLAYIGKADMNGLILASEEINNNGGINGKKIEIITDDNQGDPKVAVNGIQKLLDVDKVDLIFSAFTPITKAIAPIVKAKNIPMVYASTDGTIASESNIFFRDYFDAEQSGVALFNKVKLDGRKKVKVISEKNDACQLFIDAFKKETLKSDVKVADESYFQDSESDLRAYLIKLNLKKDEVLLACTYKHSHVLVKNMSELGLINIPTYQLVAPFLPVSNELSYRELFSKNKTISTWYGFAESNNTKRQEEFIKNYKLRFKESPDANSSYTYDDMYILSSVLGKCIAKDVIDNKCFKSEMSKINYDGVAGKVSFDENGRSNRDTLIIQAGDNQWKTVQ